MATAASKVSKRICVKIKLKRIKFEATAVWLPNRVINRCPATILAINRTAKVRGRITFLIVSITTIKGMRAPGVLWGTKWANMCLV